MRDQSCFQDWDTVILKKNHSTNTPQVNKDSQSDKSISSKEDDNIIEKPLKITTELKLAIQKARVSNKLSQKQLASLMCCQPSLINQYESGKAIPNNSFISKLEQKLKTKLPRSKKKKKES